MDSPGGGGLICTTEGNEYVVDSLLTGQIYKVTVGTGAQKNADGNIYQVIAATEFSLRWSNRHNNSFQLNGCSYMAYKLPHIDLLSEILDLSDSEPSL